jgi:hypothetical protein
MNNEIYQNNFFILKYDTNILYIKFYNIEYKNNNIDTILNNFFRELDIFYKKREINNNKFGKIYDITDLNLMPLEFLHKFSKGLNNFRERTDNIVVSSSVIIKNFYIKKLLNIFLGLYNNTRPLEVFDNLTDSKKFIYKYIV